MNKFLSLWVLTSSVAWALGFAVGLYAGFIFPIVGDIIATLLFAGVVLALQYVLLKDQNWRKSYTKRSSIGLVIGVLIAGITVLIIDKTIGLGLAHIIGFPTALIVIALFQGKSIPLPLSVWVLTNLLSVVIAFVVLGLLDPVLGLSLTVLDVRIRDYSAIPSWGFIGMITGFFYGLFTGYVLTRELSSSN